MSTNYKKNRKTDDVQYQKTRNIRVVGMNPPSNNDQNFVSDGTFVCDYVALENYDLTGAETIDGETPVQGDKILVPNQTDETENGIYTYNPSGVWILDKSLTGGALITIVGGTKKGTIWINHNPDIDPGVTPVVIKEIAFDYVDNILINSNFQIWQRGSNSFRVVKRERTSNVAKVETDRFHNYQTGDIVQIYGIADATYNSATATITVVDNYRFTYSNTGSNESLTTDATGKCLVTSKLSLTLKDNEFFADRWDYLDHSGYQMNVTPNNNGIKLKSLTTEKFGILQIVPAKELAEYLDNRLSLSIDVKSSATAKMYLSLLYWDGTADAPTRDVVSAWNADSVNPTLATNWSYADYSAGITLTGSYQTIKLEDITLPSGTNNVAFFLWFESPSYLEEIDVKNAQLIPYRHYMPYREVSYLKELTNCLRFYQKSYDIDTPPFKIVEAGKHVFATSYGTGNGSYYGMIPLAQMYKTPTITLISPGLSAAGKWRVSTGTDVAVSGDIIGQSKFALKNDAGFTISTSNITGHYVAEAEI